jgi:hypothetical protein
MTTYSIVLFVHIAAVLALFAALSLEMLSLSRLRRASTVAAVNLWMNTAPRLPLAIVGSVLVILFSGVYLTARMSAFSLGWPRVSVAAVILMAALGAMTGKRMRANPPGLRFRKDNQLRAVESTTGPVSEDVARHPNCRLCWNCTDHGCETGVVAVSEHCWGFVSARSHVVASGLRRRASFPDRSVGLGD